MLTPDEIRDIVKDEMQERFDDEYEDMIRALVLGILKQLGLDRLFNATRNTQ